MNEKADSEGKWVWGSLNNLLSHISHTASTSYLVKHVIPCFRYVIIFFLPHYYPHQMQP